MKLPSDYNKAQAYKGPSNYLPAGNYVCAITTARVEQTRSTGADMLVVELDVAEGERRGFFTQQSKSFGTWPNAGVMRLVVTVRDRQSGQMVTNPVFKGFIEAVEASNRGYSFTQTGADEYTLVLKRVGVRFREEESEYNGEVRTRVVPWYAVPVDTVPNLDIPELKKLKKDSAASEPVAAYVAGMTTANGFTQVSNDGLPF